jgi:hypothetical protein
MKTTPFFQHQILPNQITLSIGLASGREMKKLLIVFIFLGLLFASPAYAIPFGFTNITNNNIADAIIGETQLSVDVTYTGNDQVLFTFLNAGPAASSITQVYFDDGSLSGIASIDESDTGVSFSKGASPANVPGANNATPPFVTTAGFLAGADSPEQPNGVNPGESLGILFDLISGGTFSDVLDDIASGALRIGIHVQGFATGGSESFINNTSPVPEPTTMLLLGTGLIGFAIVGRKRFFKK